MLARCVCGKIFTTEPALARPICCFCLLKRGKEDGSLVLGRSIRQLPGKSFSPPYHFFGHRQRKVLNVPPELLFQRFACQHSGEASVELFLSRFHGLIVAGGVDHVNHDSETTAKRDLLPPWSLPTEKGKLPIAVHFESKHELTRTASCFG